MLLSLSEGTALEKAGIVAACLAGDCVGWGYWEPQNQRGRNLGDTHGPSAWPAKGNPQAQFVPDGAKLVGAKLLSVPHPAKLGHEAKACMTSGWETWASPEEAEAKSGRKIPAGGLKWSSTGLASEGEGCAGGTSWSLICPLPEERGWEGVAPREEREVSANAGALQSDYGK